MSASEKAADARVRDAIIAALHATRLIPVLPLIDIIALYTRFRGVVSTVAAPALHFPEHVTLWRAAASVIVSATYFHQLLADGSTTELDDGWSGSGRDKRWDASAACVDPCNPNRLFLADSISIRIFDRTKHATSGGVLLAGGCRRHYADRSGSDAGFYAISDLVCTSDGATLYVCDRLIDRLRAVDVKTGDVTTIAGDGRSLARSGVGRAASVDGPAHLAFDRTTHQPETALYVTCTKTIARFDVLTGELRTIKPEPPRPPPSDGGAFEPYGIACTSGGTILFTCSHSHSLYTLDPTTGATELVAGAGFRFGVECDGLRPGGYTNGSALTDAQFDSPAGLCVDDGGGSRGGGDSEPCVYVADRSNHVIRRVTLPPHFFAPKTS